MRKDNKTVEKTETLKNRVIRIGRNILFVALGCVAISSTVMLSEKQHALSPFSSYSIKTEDETITLYGQVLAKVLSMQEKERLT